jgi:VWFA-related protein
MRRLAPAVALVGLLGAGPQAAEPGASPPNAPASPGLVERVTVRLIQLNFLAVDDQGRPITDLRPEEVDLRIDGERTPLAFLQAYTSFVRGDEPSPGDTANPAPPAGEGDVPGPPVPPARRWIVLLFDQVNASPRTRIHSVKAAREFLESRLGPDDHVAIAVFDSRLRILQDFTKDRARLLDATARLQDTTARASEERARAVDQLVHELRNCRERGLPDLVERCATSVLTSYEEDRYRELESFLAAVRWVLNATAAVPEVKTLVLFSEGVSRVPSRDGADAADAILGSRAGRVYGPRSRFEVEAGFDAIAEAAANAKAAVFTINPGGAPRMTSVSAAREGLVGGDANTLQIDPWRSAERNAQQSLHEISWRTGGTAAMGADVLAALERVDAVSSALYTLGYYAPDGAAPPTKLKIRILRKDVRAEFQRDVPPPPPERTPIQGDLAVEAGYCGDDGRRSLKLRLRLDRSSLAFTRVAGKFTANFSMLVRLSPQPGAEPLFEDFRTLNVSSPVKEHQSGALPDPVVEQRLAIPCASLLATVTVTDAGSGARREFTSAIPE